MKEFSVFTCVTCFLLSGLLASCGAQEEIYFPPKNVTVCRGSNVTISCGYVTDTALPVTWIINGASFDEVTLVDSPLYQLNNPTEPTMYSLTVFSINHTTSFQCIVHSTININSTSGTVTVIDVPVVEITATGGCGYVNVSWTVIGNNKVCPPHFYNIKLLSSTMDELKKTLTSNNQHMFNELSYGTLFYVTGFSNNINFGIVNFEAISVRTTDFKEPIPIDVTANVKISNDIIVITISWQLQPPSCTTANIIMYNITVMDQYSPANITVPVNISSVEISEFPDNGTSIVANREYTITVSAISDQETNYPSDPVVVNTYILYHCTVTSLSTGTIRVSCDSSHLILVTLTCTNNCNNPMVTSNGSSPLTVRGLDPGMMYSVTINVFNGNQVVFSDQMVTKTIMVMGTESGISDSDSSNAGAIAGGVIGGIIAVVVIVIIIIVLYYFVCYKNKSSNCDDTMNLKSPAGTAGSHASGGDSQTNAFFDKVVYSDPSQTVTVPHQTSATGDIYAVSTKATNYANQEQLPSREYDDTCNAKQDNQGVTYADLQELPTNSERDMLDDLTPAVTYSQIA